MTDEEANTQAICNLVMALSTSLITSGGPPAATGMLSVFSGMNDALLPEGSVRDKIAQTVAMQQDVIARIAAER